MSKLIKTDNEYKEWIGELKQRIRQSQIKAAVKVNTELLKLYWNLGENIVIKQAEAKWGSGFLSQLSVDLTESFPSMQGFSKRNLELIRKWYSFYNEENTIAKQVVSQLQEAIFQVPWGHHIKIVSKCTTVQEAQFYIYKTVEYGWSCNVLLHMIESGLFHREGSSINNFSLRLPSVQSDLAHELTKDPYNFDFLTLREGYIERELEEALVSNISKLGFYVSAVNHEMCKDGDNPTIGLLVCKSKNEIVAQYTLESTVAPIGISEYELSQLYPKDFKSTLPSIEEIENELKN